MQANVLVYTDRHKRDRDFETIGNYVTVSRMIDKDLQNTVREKNITHLISTGDDYDKGYRATHATYNDIMTETELTASVNGNRYEAIGNHLFLERDSNPEMYLIQPCAKYPTKFKVEQEKPLIKVVDTLIVGCVQFSFFHFDKDNKNYVAERDPNVKYHIGIYHDDCVVPSSVRQKVGMKTGVNSSYLTKIFANIDIAVVGHIHFAIGQVNIDLPSLSKKVPMFIPGSLALTSTHPGEFHTSVNLPLFKITETSLTLELVNFNLYTNKLSFHKKKTKEIPKELAVLLGDLAVDSLTAEASLQLKLGVTKSVTDYMTSHGCSELQKAIYEHAAINSLSLKKLEQMVGVESNED